MDNTNCVVNVFVDGELHTCSREDCPDKKEWEMHTIGDGIIIEYIPDCIWKESVAEQDARDLAELRAAKEERKDDDKICPVCTTVYMLMGDMAVVGYEFKCPQCKTTLTVRETGDAV